MRETYRMRSIEAQEGYVHANNVILLRLQESRTVQEAITAIRGDLAIVDNAIRRKLYRQAINELSEAK